MRSESRIWEIRLFGLMRGGGELVIGLCASQPNRSCLLYFTGGNRENRETIARTDGLKVTGFWLPLPLCSAVGSGWGWEQ